MPLTFHAFGRWLAGRRDRRRRARLARITDELPPAIRRDIGWDGARRRLR